MGIDIKKNRKGLYRVKSTVSDQKLGEDMTEDENKKMLIERAYLKFIEETIKIDLEFPSGYYINNKIQSVEGKHCSGLEFIIKNWNNEDVIEDKFREICNRLHIVL